jgi:CheY-like chemotaxis protein
VDGVFGRRRILVVDDDAAIRDVLTQAFLEEGYEVTTAADGVAALDALATAAPDLIVLDLWLAGPLPGPAVAAAYGQLPGPRAPVLIVSARPEADLAATARAIGAAGILSKPFDLDELLETIARLLPPPPIQATSLAALDDHETATSPAKDHRAPALPPGRALQRLIGDIQALQTTLEQVRQETLVIAGLEAVGQLSPFDQQRQRILESEREALGRRLLQYTQEYEDLRGSAD